MKSLIAILLLWVTVSVAQQPAGVITGRLVSANGAPTVGVRVAAAEANDTSEPTALVGITRTDNEGRYRLDNIPPGRYWIIAGLVSSPLFYPGIADISAAKIVSVADGTWTDNVDFVEVPPAETLIVPGALMIDVDKRIQVIDDAAINNYISSLGQRILSNVPGAAPFTFKVFQSNEVNGFGLPDGSVRISRAAFLAADSEAELAGVLAHLVMHVVAGHSAQMQGRLFLSTFAAMPLIFLGGSSTEMKRLATQINVPLGYLAFGQSQEQEADALGLLYLQRSGYDPQALVQFFDKLRSRTAANQVKQSLLFSTHLPTPERLVGAQRRVGSISPANGELTSSGFEAMRARLSQLWP